MGKQLVLQLGKRPNDDLLSRWIVHYIAEQITLAETVVGKEKKQRTKQCCAAILELWKHRAVIPGKSRPLENFEPILAALRQLDPESRVPLYYKIAPPITLHPARRKNSKREKMQQILSLVCSLDQSARVLIKELLHEAAQLATDTKAKSILEVGGGLPNSAEIEIFNSLRADGMRRPTQTPKDKIKSRIEKLSRFIDIASRYRDEMTTGRQL